MYCIQYEVTVGKRLSVRFLKVCMRTFWQLSVLGSTLLPKAPLISGFLQIGTLWRPCIWLLQLHHVHIHATYRSDSDEVQMRI
jgi:hypothetical protein